MASTSHRCSRGPGFAREVQPKSQSETSPKQGRNPIAQGQLGDPLRRVNQFMLIFFR